ncbi:WhiB family transcriptional regulator [Streptomyces sp. NPDC002886]|uniref:WhiB family transcriptional regulator n=1 Tax=Streptomyces sp. NPDC002886 TaxID=3364667 RepID=UPI0036966063
MGTTRPRPAQEDDWWKQAVCTSDEECAELFYSEASGAAARAKRICFSCPARGACLAYARETVEEFGIWGGLTGQERRARGRYGQSGGG